MAVPVRAAGLAVDGGVPVREAPFPFWPQFAEAEIRAVEAILRSGKVNYWTGPEGRAFEAEYAAHTGKRYAVAVANGTLALELALAVLEIGAGDEVITTSRTFLASASCAVMRGARPVFADVDRDSGNITAATVERVITQRTKAIIPVHLGGWPCEMARIRKLADAHGLKIIEDCAQAHGALADGKPVGSYGDINAFSFCQDKIITTGGEGGLIVTDNQELWQRAWAFKDHGKSFAAVHERNHPPGFRWLHESFGSNWRLTESQSAIGRLQLRRLGEMVARRTANAQYLAATLRMHPALRVPDVPSGDTPSYYRFYCYLRPERLRESWSRDQIVAAVSAEGVPCFSGSCSEIYLEKAFPLEWRPEPRLPVARELGETSLAFLVHPTLSEAEMRDTTLALEKVLAAATR